ncbi:Heavy metal RND efflux outer membrane protein, CzcC family protein [Minicystis rosea]|nr:Heavy metal RND efflux outer membrane protein, CzcC family protein [Minicystis rosea]
MSRRTLSALALLASLAPAPARADTPQRPAAPSNAVAPSALTHPAFLARVAKGNLDFLAQRANVTIAEAQIAVAKAFPDPTLTVGIASLDVSGKGAQAASTVGITHTIELGGKRGARVGAAQSDLATTRADVDDALRTLRGTATIAFIESLRTRLLLSRKRRTEQGLETLVTVNEERQRAGDIGKVALTQSRVEAQRFHGEVITAEADVDTADLALAQLAGEPRLPGEPSGDLRIKPRTFDAATLIAQAKAHRPDLLARRRAAEAATGRVDLARANRFIDVTFNVGWQHTFASTAAPFRAPAYEALTATVSVPLPFSRVYRGEIGAALATEEQARTTADAAALRVEIEVRQALVRYDAAVKKLAQYTGGLLADADQVIEATLYNYKRGGATLLEVLEAQRTQNDVYLAYYDALADHARTLVAVELAAGMWDVEL